MAKLALVSTQRSHDAFVLLDSALAWVPSAPKPGLSVGCKRSGRTHVHHTENGLATEHWQKGVQSFPIFRLSSRDNLSKDVCGRFESALAAGIPEAAPRDGFKPVGRVRFALSIASGSPG